MTLFKSFGRFLSGCGCCVLRIAGEDATFDKAGFIQSLPESMRSFAEPFVQTQLFEGMTVMLLHKDDTAHINEETQNLLQLVRKCVGMLKDDSPEAVRESVGEIRRLLHPKNWKLRDVRLPAIGKPAEDEEWERVGGMRNRVLKVLSGRDGKVFPFLEEVLWGDSFTRYDI